MIYLLSLEGTSCISYLVLLTMIKSWIKCFSNRSSIYIIFPNVYIVLKIRNTSKYIPWHIVWKSLRNRGMKWDMMISNLMCDMAWCSIVWYVLMYIVGLWYLFSFKTAPIDQTYDQRHLNGDFRDALRSDFVRRNAQHSFCPF